MQEEKRILEISWTSLWRTIFFVALGAIFYLSADIILALFVAIIISAGLDFFIDFLEKKGVPRMLGTILIFIFIAFVFVLTLYAIIPRLIIDLNIIINNLNQYGFGKILPGINLEARDSFKEIIDRLSTNIFTGNYQFEIFLGFLNNAFIFISIIIISFYLSLSKDGIERFIRAVFPKNYEVKALIIYEKSKRRIARWFRTQIFLSLTIFTLVLIALLILGVKNAFSIALLAGVFEIVPYVGPIMTAIIATISALTTSIPLAIYTLIIFILIQQAENHILVPIFIKKTIDLHPVIVIVALLVGGKIAGVLGLIIAVPTAVVIQEIIEELSHKSKTA